MELWLGHATVVEAAPALELVLETGTGSAPSAGIVIEVEIGIGEVTEAEAEAEPEPGPAPGVASGVGPVSGLGLEAGAVSRPEDDTALVLVDTVEQPDVDRGSIVDKTDDKGRIQHTADNIADTIALELGWQQGQQQRPEHLQLLAD